MAYMLGISHNALMEEMTHEEYAGWSNYLERQPPGWRDDLRAYYIMTSMSGSKTKPEKIFPSIAQLKSADLEATKEEKEAQEHAKMQQSLKASPFGAILANATKNRK